MPKLIDYLIDDNAKNPYAAKTKKNVEKVNAKWVDGLLVDNKGNVIQRSMPISEAVLNINSFMPVTGDIQAGVMAANDLRKGDYGSAALNSLGLLPFVPALGATVGKGLTKYELAQLKAQENATKMLGLPPDNTAMDRAKALGFDSGTYHGSPVADQITDDGYFKIGGQGVDVKNGQALGSGIYTTTGQLEASSYARDGAVFPLMIKRNNHLNIYNPSQEDLSKMSKFAGEQMLPSDKAGMDIPRSTKVFNDVKDAREFYSSQVKNWEQFGGGFQRQIPRPIKNADGTFAVEYTNFDGEVPIKSGNDVANFLNKVGYESLKDSGYSGHTFTSNTGNTWDVTNNPAMIRSRFAAFDPARINDPDLLGIATPEMLALLAAGSAGGIAYAKNKKDKKAK